LLSARKSRGEALVFATLDRLAPADAAFVNSAFAMALDFDDYLLSLVKAALCVNIFEATTC